MSQASATVLRTMFPWRLRTSDPALPLSRQGQSWSKSSTSKSKAIDGKDVEAVYSLEGTLGSACLRNWPNTAVVGGGRQGVVVVVVVVVVVRWCFEP